MADVDLLRDLELLGADLGAGTERLAAERERDHREALSDWVSRAVAYQPKVVAVRERGWGLPDVVAVLAVLALIGLGGRAAWILADPETAPETVSRVTLGRGAEPVREADLAGRILLTLPIESASYALLGDLPTRLSAAVVPASAPEDGAPLRPIARFDDLLVLDAEASGDQVAVLVAVPPAEAERLLAALPDTVVHLLRLPPAPPPHGTP
jgi:hypothetical protein